MQAVPVLSQRPDKATMIREWNNAVAISMEVREGGVVWRRGGSPAALEHS